MTRCRLAAAALAALLSAAPAVAQTTGDSCSTLQTKYNEDIRTANSLIMKLTNQILNSTSTPDILGKLGLDPKSIGSPEQAVRKGAVAAMPPNAQTAILIYLLSANTTMQTMRWKGCKPSSG